MAVDLTKIKVGDKVRLGGEAEVLEVKRDFLILADAASVYGRFTVHRGFIAEHLPAPKQFAVGDVIEAFGRRYLVLHRGGEMLMVKNLSTGAYDLRTPADFAD